MHSMKPRCDKLLPRLQIPCNGPMGHRGLCYHIDRVRARATTAAWALANPERVAANTKAWIAANPQRVKDNKDAWYAANTDKVAATQHAYYVEHADRVCSDAIAWSKAHPEKTAASQAKYAKANPKRKAAKEQKRRAIKKGATAIPYAQAEYKARMAEFGDACYYCALLGIVGPHECDDHVFPLQPRKGHKAGPHALRNLVPSCSHHNNTKSNKQPIDFINQILLAQTTKT